MCYKNLQKIAKMYEQRLREVEKECDNQANAGHKQSK